MSLEQLEKEITKELEDQEVNQILTSINKNIVINNKKIYINNIKLVLKIILLFISLSFFIYIIFDIIKRISHFLVINEILNINENILNSIITVIVILLFIFIDGFRVHIKFNKKLKKQEMKG